MFRTPVSIALTAFAKHLALLNVIFPAKITTVHKVWSWSLGGQGVILTGLPCPCILALFELKVTNRAKEGQVLWIWISDLSLAIKSGS